MTYSTSCNKEEETRENEITTYTQHEHTKTRKKTTNKKKSVKRRQEILKAIYKQKLYVNENY